MKAKHALMLFAVGLGVDFMGVLLKILHWRHGGELLAAGLLLKVVGSLLFLCKLLTYPQVRRFLNQ